jgi:hypothetical protein
MMELKRSSGEDDQQNEGNKYKDAAKRNQE